MVPPSLLVISQGWGLSDLPLRASNRGGESSTAGCASTEDQQAPSPPLFREQEDDQAYPSLPKLPRYLS